MTATFYHTRPTTVRWAILLAGWFLICLVPGTGLSEENQAPEKQVYEMETGFYYTIKKGDTLWDLSQRFFDSPWTWPDLWEKNRDLSNPHWIYPGNKIRVFSREGMEGLAHQEESLGLDTSPLSEEAPKTYFYPAMDSVGFVKKVPVSPAGYIFRVEAHKEIIGEGDVVSLNPNPGTTFEPGQRYTVFRMTETFKDKKTKELIGVQHYIVGLVDVFEVHKGIATAAVYRSYRNIEIDDYIMPYEHRSPYIQLAPSAANLRGQILAPEEGVEVIGDNTIVFIDKGRRDGVQIGQLYNMFYQDEKAFGSWANKEHVLLAPVDTGNILVVHAEENASTALITKVHHVIESGMQIRTP